MDLARFYSMDDVFAFRRLVHEKGALVLGLQKRFHFINTAGRSSCYRVITSSKFADFVYLTEWMNGNKYVSRRFFKNTVGMIRLCKTTCFYMTLDSTNKFIIKDLDCSYRRISIACYKRLKGE